MNWIYKNDSQIPYVRNHVGKIKEIQNRLKTVDQKIPLELSPPTETEPADTETADTENAEDDDSSGNIQANTLRLVRTAVLSSQRQWRGLLAGGHIN